MPLPGDTVVSVQIMSTPFSALQTFTLHSRAIGNFLLSHLSSRDYQLVACFIVGKNGNHDDGRFILALSLCKILFMTKWNIILAKTSNPTLSNVYPLWRPSSEPIHVKRAPVLDYNSHNALGLALQRSHASVTAQQTREMCK